METFNLDRSYRNRVAEVLDSIERLKDDIADLLNVERISNVYSMGAVSHSKPSFETDKGRIWKGPFIEEVGF